MTTDYFEPDAKIFWIVTTKFDIDKPICSVLFSIVRAHNRLLYDISMNDLHNDNWFIEWSMMNELDKKWMNDADDILSYYINQNKFPDEYPIGWRRLMVVRSTIMANDDYDFTMYL